MLMAPSNSTMTFCLSMAWVEMDLEPGWGAHTLSPINFDPNSQIEIVVQSFLAVCRYAQIGQRPIIWFVHSLGGISSKKLFISRPSLGQRPRVCCLC
jgi:hypothetical protein